MNNSSKQIQLNYVQDTPKGTILGELSKIFDPLGLPYPVIIKGRIFIQQLWQEKVSKEKPLNDDIQRCWKSYANELAHIQDIRIPRQVQTTNKGIELVGFCEASQHAYNACMLRQNNVMDLGCHVLFV